MARQSGYEHIYCYVLQGNLNILADERDKKLLLDIVLGIQLAEQFRLYAFCITDESVHLLLGGLEKPALSCAAKRMITDFGTQRIKDRQIKPQRRTGECLTVTEKRMLRSVAEIKEKCREIHLLPLKLGYVTDIRNYWWSSYRTYLGYYHWNQVDCSVILQMFASDRESAVRRFRKYHESLTDSQE